MMVLHIRIHILDARYLLDLIVGGVGMVAIIIGLPAAPTF